MKSKLRQTFYQDYRRAFYLLVATVLIAASLSLLQLLIHQQRTASLRRSSDFQQEISKLDDRARYIESRIAKLERPERLEALGRELGLVPATPNAIVWLEHTPQPAVVQVTETDLPAAKEPFIITYDLALLEAPVLTRR